MIAVLPSSAILRRTISRPHHRHPPLRYEIRLWIKCCKWEGKRNVVSGGKHNKHRQGKGHRDIPQTYTHSEQHMWRGESPVFKTHNRVTQNDDDDDDDDDDGDDDDDDDDGDNDDDDDDDGDDKIKERYR
ncbi:hypothetical protein E2C01_081332 [Portunus trituberculatus]|uniref:Uncharacterized protein n=1 Tax=Portunus trituberculatus TaxID=210409 RepID=A0A5B7IRN6_PORTR|nr:hypothetical protein [Portunus trituberculatus]